jgi:hypothetical protein
MSETKSCRDRLEVFCAGAGADFGHGGYYSIWPETICVDQFEVLQGHEQPAHIIADLFSQHLFDNLDYIYSSHCLEDAEDTAKVLDLWLGQLRVGGKLVLFLPDQQTYLRHCEATGQDINTAHKHNFFCLEFVRIELSKVPIPHKIIYEAFPVPNNPYSFDLVIERL